MNHCFIVGCFSLSYSVLSSTPMTCMFVLLALSSLMYSLCPVHWRHSLDSIYYDNTSIQNRSCVPSIHLKTEKRESRAAIVLSFHMTWLIHFGLSCLPIKGVSSHMIFISATRNLVWGWSLTSKKTLSFQFQWSNLLSDLRQTNQDEDIVKTRYASHNTFEDICTKERYEPHPNNLAIALQTETTGTTRKQESTSNTEQTTSTTWTKYQ